MKKSIFIVVLVATLAACTTNKYEIRGTVDTSAVADSSFVYLKTREVRTWVTKDSAQVLNGSFTMKGQAEKAYTAYLILTAKEGGQPSLPIVVEPGKTKVAIDADFQVVRSGTAQNILLQEYSTAQRASYEAFEKQVEALKGEGADEEAIGKVSAEFYQQDVQSSVDFIVKNANSAVANFIFTTTYYSMNIAQKEEIVALMNAESLAYDRVPLIVEGLEVEKKTAPGKMFTEIELPTPSGEMGRLSDYVGKTEYLLIDFWASWCGPCLRSFPELTALYNRLPKGKLEIIGVSLDNNDQAWKAAIERYALTWPHLSDLAGWESAGAKLYGVNSIPCTVLLDKNGIIVGRNMSKAEIELLLQ